MNPFIRGIVLVWLLAFSSLTWAAESSTCGTDWRSIAPNHDPGINDMVWADELQLWVAVGGVIMTSPDGITWSLQNSDITNGFRSVVWSGTQFVAVGYSGVILTSPDGITWTSRSSGTTKSLYSITWSGSQFVVVGEGGTILSSPDGFTWTKRSSSTDVDLAAITWGGSQFVAVGGESGMILTSSDGITWTPQNSGNTGRLNDITWSGSQFVAVGEVILTSPDGITWTLTLNYLQYVGFSPFAWFTGISWNGRLFVAVGGYSIDPWGADFNGGILTSPDGITWTSRHFENSHDYGNGFIDYIAWNGSQFVAGHGFETLTSPDGITWTSHSSSPNIYSPGFSATAITWSGSQFVAVGSYGRILTSPNGTAWARQNSGTDMDIEDIAWNGSQFVAVGWHYYSDGNENTILTSPDGITWTQQNSGTTHGLYGITWSGRQFVAVGSYGTILTSPDGITWTQQNSGINSFINAITWSGRRFVAVGSDGMILTSPNGTGWIRQNSGTDMDIEDIAWNGSQFVAVGYEGTILTSPPEGITWTQQNSGTPYNLYGITWSGSQLVAVGHYDMILTSPNGTTWTPQDSDAPHYPGYPHVFTLYDITWSGSQFVVVGDGISLTSRCKESAYLESPQEGSLESGIGLIRGWVCQADEITIQVDDHPLVKAAYGTTRKDTLENCGDDNNGFGLTLNWNRLGSGQHTVKAFANGVKFGDVSFTITALDVETPFLRGVQKSQAITDFPAHDPHPFTLVWSESNQNFMIGTDQPPSGSGSGNDATHQLENPQAGAFASGIGLISGWVCQADEITLQIDDHPLVKAAYGTTRADTVARCGDDNNGFGLTLNWNILGDGQHTVKALADGIEFARASFTVTTLGDRFLREVSGSYGVDDFPAPGNQTTVQWSQALQNFVITGKQ